MAKCHWTETRTRSTGTGKNRRTTTYTVHYNGSETFLNSKTYLFGSKGADAVEVQPGRTTYTFAIALPVQLPETLAAALGSIAYSVEAILDIPWSFDKEIRVDFTVVRQDNLNDYPELKVAQNLEEVNTFCCLFCESGPCMINVSIPYGGYAAGQSINMLIEVVNQSNVEIERTRIRLKRFTNYTSSTPETKTRSESTTILEIFREGIKEGERKRMECSLLLPSILTNSNGRFCRVVRIEYVLQVEGVVGGCHSNPKVNFPIEIGSVAIGTIINPPHEMPQQPFIAPSAPLAPHDGDDAKNDLRKFQNFLNYFFFLFLLLILIFSSFI